MIPLDIGVARAQAASFLETVTPARYDSPEADVVGQRRQRVQTYSACADLAHAMFEALGQTAHPHVNRAPGWRCGKNISLLATWPGALRRVDWLDVDAGDVLVRWRREDTTDAHVVCVLAPAAGGAVRTAEYGQARPTIGRTFSRVITEGRPWQIWLPLPVWLGGP